MNDKIVCGHDECGISSLTSLVIKNKHRLKLKAHFDAGVTLNVYAHANYENAVKQMRELGNQTGTADRITAKDEKIS